MLWEAHAWKHRSDSWYQAKAIMEERVWRQLTNPYNNLALWNGETTPLEIIEAQGLEKSDVNLQKIYLIKNLIAKNNITKSQRHNGRRTSRRNEKN